MPDANGDSTDGFAIGEVEYFRSRRLTASRRTSLTVQLRCCLLRVEEHEGDENNDDDEELQETHPDEQIREEIFLHRRVACDANDKGSEQLADARRTATNRDHAD